MAGAIGEVPSSAGDYRPTATVRLQTFERWEVCGADRFPEVVPESITATANEWGPDTIGFVLRRRAGDVHPDLSAFTPCELEIDGRLVWTGSVWEVPTREAPDEITVQGRGAQYELDDDLLPMVLVHATLSDWIDAVDVSDVYGPPDPSTDTGFQVDQGDSAITISLPKGSDIDGRGGVMLDLGEGGFRRFTITYRGGGSDYVNIRAMGSAIPGTDWATPSSEAQMVNDAPITTVLTTETITFSSRWRYLSLFLSRSNTTVVGRNAWVKILNLTVYRDIGFEDSDASALVASDVVKEARDRGTLLSPSDERITDTTLTLPEYAPDGDQTPREAIEAANAYHGFRTQVDTERRVVFEPYPNTPSIEVGSWAPGTFEDAALSSGEELYSDVIVTGTDADGEPLRVHVSELDLWPAPPAPLQALAPDYSGSGNWTASAGSTITHGSAPPPFTGEGLTHRTPAGYGTSSVLFSATAPDQIEGALVPGREYVYGLWVILFNDHDDSWKGAFRLRAGSAANDSFTEWPSYEITPDGRYTSDGALIPLRHHFIAPVDQSDFRLAIELIDDEAGSNPLNLFVGPSIVRERGRSLLGQRGRHRVKELSVEGTITPADAQLAGETFLRDHLRPPLRGDLRAARGTFRRVVGGRPLAAYELLRQTGESVRLAHRLDPDTGDWGREGRLASVSYEHDSGEATVSIGSDRSRLDVLLARMGLSSPTLSGRPGTHHHRRRGGSTHSRGRFYGP